MNERGQLTRERAYLQQAIPYIEDTTQQMLLAVQKRVFLDLDAGDLTPEGALSAWIEVRAVHEMLRKLRKQALSEVSQAEQALHAGLIPPTSRT